MTRQKRLDAAPREEIGDLVVLLRNLFDQEVGTAAWVLYYNRLIDWLYYEEADGRPCPICNPHEAKNE